MLHPFPSRTQTPWVAIGFYLIACTAFASMSVGIRFLSTQLSAPMIVTLRTALTVVILLPWALRHGAARLRTERFADHLIRGTIGTAGMLLWTYSLTRMNLNDATALSFTAPLFSTLLAVLWFKEKASPRRWLTLLMGFAGVLLILHPSTATFEPIALVVMLATLFWAMTGMAVKSLTRTEPPLRIVFYMHAFMVLWTAPIAAMDWQWPTPHGWIILGLIALCSMLMHVTTAHAYRRADVVQLMPFDFIRLIVTAGLASLFFAESIAPSTWIGGAVILGSAILSLSSDAKQPRTP